MRASRREVITWLLFVALLIAVGYLQTVLYTRNQETAAASSGGIYHEGVIDKIATINPLYITSEGEQAVSGLVYSGLLRLDETGSLRPDLAVSYSVSSDGKTYDIKLRDNVKWSDGKAFSADDVVFTVNLIKNPVINSTLFGRWKNIDVKKINNLEVSFTRKDVMTSFPYTLDFGILPAHVLKSVKPSAVKNTFSDNTAAVVGTGPFVYRSEEILSESQIIYRFVANEHYFCGKPRVTAVTIQTYATSEDLLKGFKTDEINIAAGLDVTEAAKSLSISSADLSQIKLGDGVFALFNNSGKITGDLAVREALRLGVDRAAVREAVIYRSDEKKLKSVWPLETPITPGLVADIDKLKQPDYNAKAATEKLDAAGWKLNSDGKRMKDGQIMRLSVATVKGKDYEIAAKKIAEQWRELGIEVELTAVDPSSIQQNYLIPRAYDVLVYQFHLGADPDISAYWTSSQATASGSNFANYRSKLADLALNNARTQMDAGKRATNYTYFVKQYWLPDVPAIALYQPNYYYLAANDVEGLSDRMSLPYESSRFAGIRDFTVNTDQFRVTP